MKLRYKILYMSFGAGLVVLGMILNSSSLFLFKSGFNLLSTYHQPTQ